MNPILISGSHGATGNYIQALRAQGTEGEARYAPMADASRYSGLLLCGGGDLNPVWYGAKTKGNIGIEPERECSDFYMISQFASQKKPILGICRGMQVLNVFFGGSLVPDLSHRNEIHRGQKGSDCSHIVKTGANSLMQRLYGTQTVVNSCHHQAVDRIGRGFRSTMKSLDGVVEALEHQSLPIIAVQWHPERILQKNGYADGNALFLAFAQQCKNFGTD